MSRMGPRLIVLVALQCIVLAAARTLLVDSRSGSYLRQQGPGAVGRISSPQALLSGLTGLLPAADVDADVSQQIDELIRPSPFKKPRCHFTLNVAGLTEEEVLQALSGRPYLAIEAAQEQASLEDVLAAIAGSNPSVPLVIIDQAAVQDCDIEDAACLLSQLPMAVQDVGLELPELDASVQEDQLFSSELAALFSGLKAALQQANNYEDIQLMQASMLGLQSLRGRYGGDSSMVAASKAVTQKLLAWAVEQLDVAFEGDVTMQIATLDALPSDASFDEVVSYKQRAHGRLLAQATTATAMPANVTTPAWLSGGNQTAMSKIFAAKAAGYGGFLLMLYFMLGSVYCMCFMPIKHDTLLFGAKKTDI